MLTGRRYRLELTPEQAAYAERVAGICRFVWNAALEQRQIYRQRGSFVGYHEQRAQLVEAKQEEAWLTEAPSHCLLEVLRDLEKACRVHGASHVHWKSKTRSVRSFRFPDRNDIAVKRLNRRWGTVKLPKFGWVRFRWTRPLGGELRNATVLRDGEHWYVSFCVEDGKVAAEPSGKPAIGIDRGVATTLAMSDGQMCRIPILPKLLARINRLQQQLARQRKGSARRAQTKREIARLWERIRVRRKDWIENVTTRMAGDYDLLVLEKLNTPAMTRKPKAKPDPNQPGAFLPNGRRAKAGLNRVILRSCWGAFATRLEQKAERNGGVVLRIDPRYTSQTCRKCGHCAPENRETQAQFSCVACGHRQHADIHASQNVLARGLDLAHSPGHGDHARVSPPAAGTTLVAA